MRWSFGVGRTKLVIGARRSPLSRTQVDEVLPLLQSLFPDTEILTEFSDTPGDRDRVTPLDADSVTDDFFTRDLDSALLNRSVDITANSAKDLPDCLHPDLEAIYLPAKDIRDSLVCRKGVIPNSNDSIVVGTSSPRRSKEIKRLYPNSILKPIRGNIQDRINQLDDGNYDAVIIATCALMRLGLEERSSEYLPYDPAPNQGRLSLVYRKADKEIANILRPVDVRQASGLVALVGCPADPSYLSRKAETYLKQADVVLHDRLIPDEILLSIQDKGVPVGKCGRVKSMSQADIHQLMLTHSERGELVVRLHGGDPCIYGHLSEELEFLRDWNLRYDIVTTVTAAQVISAHAGSPLTHRGDNGDITFIPGYKEVGESMNYPGPDRGNLAIYMGVSSIDNIVEGLHIAGWPEDTPILAGERLGYRDEKHTTCTLSTLKNFNFARPSVFLVGTQRFPHPGWTLFVGTDPSNFLTHGPLLHWPLIKLHSVPLEERQAYLQEHLKTCDGVLFPSRFAVHSFMETLIEISDSRSLQGKHILSVGPATTEELKSVGLSPDACIDHYGGIESLRDTLKGTVSGRILYPCSSASPVEKRVERLADIGIELIPLPFYRNRSVDYQEYPNLPIQRVLFTSSSCVKAYFDSFPEEVKADRDWLAVGPSTYNTLKELGLTPSTIHPPKKTTT